LLKLDRLNFYIRKRTANTTEGWSRFSLYLFIPFHSIKRMPLQSGLDWRLRCFVVGFF